MGGGGAAGGIPHLFPQPSSAVCGTHPYAFVQPLVRQGDCARGGHPGFNCQGCGGACSASLSRFLQPSVCGLENLGVVTSGHRSLIPQSLCGCVTLPDGDHPVCSPFYPSGRLDGLHRSSGGVPSGSGSSGISSLPPLCVQWPRLSVQSTVLWPIHGPAGFHSGHGSCFCHPPLAGYPHAPLPRRLASPVLLSGVSSPGSLGGPGSLSRAGYCGQPREIQPRSFSGCPLSQGDHQYPVFCGFSVTKSRTQASVNRRRISILRLASRQCLAFSAGDAFLHGSPSSRGQAAHAVSPTLSSPVLGLVGPVNPCGLVPGMPSRLQWWLHLPRLSQGVSLHQVSPDLDFWSDASDVGWGAHLGPLVASGLWDESESHLPINARELLAIRRGLLHFQSSLLGKTVAVFCNNVTTVAYLRKAGGTRSPFLNSIAQGILRWWESLAIRLGPQFIPGSHNVLADSLSRPHQLLHSEWSLNMTVFQSLSRQWPVQIDLFATSANHRCLIYFSPYRDPQSAGTDAFLQSLDGLQAYAFPPFSHHSPGSSQAPGVSGDGAHASGSALASAALVSGPPPALAGPSSSPPRPSRPPTPASVSSPLPGSPQATASCLETLRHFTRVAGFSSDAAAQASLARRPSSRAN